MEETFKDEQYLMLSLFEELRNDELLTDVVIITNDGTRFLCHKIILMAGCPFFRGLFRSEMVETRQKEVYLKKIDINGTYFNQILKFIYTGEITLNFENAKAINIYSGLFSMNNLKNLSEIFLIKTISSKSCLQLWRHSDKYFCDNLKKACLVSASTQTFLDAIINDLTLEDIKSIANFDERNCSSKILLENIVKWIKVDFEIRQQYITDLMELINFDDIEDKEFKNQIFSDEILMQNKEFLTLTVKYLTRQNAINVPRKKLFVVTEPNIFYTDFDTKNFIKITQSISEGLYSFGISHSRNGFITTGGCSHGRAVKSCKVYCPTTSQIQDISSLIEARSAHKNYTLGSKIYSCAGKETNRVEIYDETSDEWIYGPAMNSSLFNFGSADDNENSLYAISGSSGSSGFSDSIFHLDTRTESWQKIYTDQLLQVGHTHSIFKDNQIYSFGTLEGFIFDIRAKKKLSKVPYNLDNAERFELTGGSYNCTLVDNDIWLLGSLYMKTKHFVVEAVKLNLSTNQWERQMFNQYLFDDMDPVEGLSLVWCS